jgi:hypothetical protein
VIEFEQPAQRAEQIEPSVRVLHVEPVAWEFRVDATMIQFEVYAELVSSTTNALRREHLSFEVIFSDGPNGDDGLIFIGNIKWPDETVVFSDGLSGNDGLVIWTPATAHDDLIFADIDLLKTWAIPSQEFVSFYDYAIDYTISKATTENATFHELSASWSAINQHEELSVTLVEGFTETGGMANKAPEVFLISESLMTDDGTTLTFALGEAFFISETIDLLPTAPAMYEDFYITDTLRVDAVGVSDARPGAFVPGAALLGSPK